jgi:predicted nuclease of predicted toxin-antitoxin system
MIRFHLDEHVPSAVAIGLRRRGIDVTTTSDAGLAGAGDQQHVAFARSQGRVIVTHDDDFLVLNSQGIAHAGIAYCHQGSRSTGELLRLLLVLNECLTSKEMENRVEFL